MMDIKYHLFKSAEADRLTPADMKFDSGNRSEAWASRIIENSSRISGYYATQTESNFLDRFLDLEHLSEQNKWKMTRIQNHSSWVKNLLELGKIAQSCEEGPEYV